MSKERLKWQMTTPVFDGDTAINARSADLAAIGISAADLCAHIKARYGDTPLVFTVDETARASQVITGIIDEHYGEAQKIYVTSVLSYNPLDEYKEYEYSTRTPNLTYERTANLSEAETGSPSTTQENQISAYNQSTYAPESKTTINETLGRTLATTGTDKNTETGYETNEIDRNGRRGKSAQELIQEERDIYVDLVSWYGEKLRVIFQPDMASLWEVMGGVNI